MCMHDIFTFLSRMRLQALSTFCSRPRSCSKLSSSNSSPMYCLKSYPYIFFVIKIPKRLLIVLFFLRKIWKYSKISERKLYILSISRSNNDDLTLSPSSICCSSRFARSIDVSCSNDN